MANKAKRNADNYLTADTVDEDVDDEPVGSFQKASEEKLAKRKITSARRKRPGDGAASKTSSPFAGFKGFGSKTGSNLQSLAASPSTTLDTSKSPFAAVKPASKPSPFSAPIGSKPALGTSPFGAKGGFTFKKNPPKPADDNDNDDAPSAKKTFGSSTASSTTAGKSPFAFGAKSTLATTSTTSSAGSGAFKFGSKASDSSDKSIKPAGSSSGFQFGQKAASDTNDKPVNPFAAAAQGVAVSKDDEDNKNDIDDGDEDDEDDETPTPQLTFGSTGGNKGFTGLKPSSMFADSAARKMAQQDDDNDDNDDDNNDKAAVSTAPSSQGASTTNGSSGWTAEQAADLKALNDAFVAHITQQVATPDIVDLSPVVKDYLNHVASIKSSAGSTKTTTTNATATTTTTTAAPIATATSSEDTSSGAAQPEDDEDGEELFNMRAKLFYQAKDKAGNVSWRNKGVGQLRLLKEEEDGRTKVRLLVRADGATRLVLLNVYLPKGTIIGDNMKNTVSLPLVPNPVIKPGKDDAALPTVVPFLIKVKQESAAETLATKLKECVAML